MAKQSKSSTLNQMEAFLRLKLICLSISWIRLFKGDILVKKIVGFDEEGKKIFERDARAYDNSIANTPFGITLSDIFKVVPVFILIITVYVNQQNFNVQILTMVNNNTSAVVGIKEVLGNLNNYLSSTTGKQFKDGRPY